MVKSLTEIVGCGIYRNSLGCLSDLGRYLGRILFEEEIQCRIKQSEAADRQKD